MNKAIRGFGVASFLTVALVLQTLTGLTSNPAALAIGLGSPVRFAPVRVHHVVTKKRSAVVRATKLSAHPSRQNKKQSRKNVKASKHAAKAAPPVKAIPPQDFVDQMSTKTLAPGVVYKYYHGPISVNVIEADLINAPVTVKPLMASSSFNRLANVQDHAVQAKAMAAVNANYFKKDGTPLGTLIVDKEWISGPLYERVSMGITRCGYVRIDRVNLYGVLTSDNAKVKSLWVNNINQPRRHGSRLVVYTKRWGSMVKLPYYAMLVAVNSNGEVIHKVAAKSLDIPRGGYVLTDLKEGEIGNLELGDRVSIMWHTTPNNWNDVTQAVSGGPMLLKDGKLYVDAKQEQFKAGWTGAGIKARTAAGVTLNNHLLLVTVEGPHTLWDMAKLLQKLGAVDAMNLDGGGSTTMVVGGSTVTKNGSSYQRRVASSLALLRNADAAQDAAAEDPNRFHQPDFNIPETNEAKTADPSDQAAVPSADASSDAT
jgi:exopolysaccharide biosynthesis protein